MANPSTSNLGNSSHVNSSLKGKRKKAVPPNANPMFTKWITEWKNEAIEKGWKSQYNYSKALKTLKMFPLCLESGKDCRMLQNFGDKICKMLDEKLAEHKRKQVEETVDDNPQLIKQTQLEPLMQGHSAVNSEPSATSTSTIHAISDNSDSGKEDLSPKKKKKRKTSGRQPREYVPAYRSGPYALILTMYRYSLDPDYKGFMTKAELMHAAQPLADKSFTIPDAGSHYTAWSSMGTLIKRMLIIKIGSPAKYHLTQQGADLGERLENAEKDEDNSQTTAMYKDSRCDENTIIDSGSPIKSSSATTTTTTTAPMAASAATPNLDHLDHLDLSAEEKAFILEGMAQDANPASNVQPFRLEKNLIDDPVYVLSDDDDQINFNPPETSTDSHRINFSPPKISKTHSLSPSLSPPSSPETRTTNVLKNFEDKFENSVNDSVCVMDYDDDDAVDLYIPGDDQTPPARLRLPSLSPVPSISESESHNHQFELWSAKDQHKSSYISTEKLLTNSNRNDDGVIEIDDDEENDDNSNFREKIFKESKSDHVHCSLFQTSESSEGRKRKNIFSNIDHLFSQKSLSDDDDDDLPDLDICVPLSKRLFNKGAVSSQLLSHFSTDHINTDSNKVSSTVPEKSNKLPTKSHASHDNDVVVLEDDDSESALNVPFTSITPKVKTVDNLSKMDTNCDNIKAALPTTSECVNGPKGLEVLPENHPTPEFTLLPGTYEIVLCIDNREFYGSKSNSKTLLPDLIQRGVNCDLRLLHIGDILWVAREKGKPNEGISSPDRKELVLNFAIERKRMDDLVSSITGGRLKEQKFRLKHCGVSELIILIEEYGSIQNFSISEDRIKQSIVNSQILDGFKVKRCGSSKEAVLYLSMMTRFIQKYYGNKTLHAASHDHVKLRAAKATVRDQEYYLMPFQTFNETSIKHKALTVKEMFGKQLIQIPGVSLERACAITKVFPTLTSLLKAYENCTSEKSKESLLATIKCGSKERNLGIAISRMMHMLYNTSKLS